MPVRESRSGVPCHSLGIIPEECGGTPKTWCSATKTDRKGHTVQDTTTGNAPNEDLQNLGPREKQHALGSLTELKQEEAEEHSGPHVAPTASLCLSPQRHLWIRRGTVPMPRGRPRLPATHTQMPPAGHTVQACQSTALEGTEEEGSHELEVRNLVSDHRHLQP